MKIIVMGAGAVGGFYGAKLARAAGPDTEVWLIARGEHLARIRAAGLLVKSFEGDFRVHPAATDEPASLGPADLILNCVKTYDLEASCRLLASNIGPETTLLTLQNGVEAPERAAALIGRRHLLGGIAYLGSRLAGPGLIEHTALGQLAIGELDGSMTPRLGRLQGLFGSCGIPCRLSPDIMLDMWKKLVWNVGFNAICALTRLTAQEVLAKAEGEGLVREAMAELVQVARARGTPLSLEAAERNIELTRRLGPITPSMAQDILRGKPTEIEEMNGAVVRLGVAAGVPTPVNRLLASLVRLIEPEAAEKPPA